MADKSYSVIWDGSEEDMAHQRDYLTKFGKANSIRTGLFWKAKTIQERVCQYVGNPKIKHERYSSLLGKIEQKYKIFKGDQAKLDLVRGLVGQEFLYTTTKSQQYAVISLFTALKDNKVTNTWEVRQAEKTFNDKEEVEAFISAQPLTARQTSKISYDNIRGYDDCYEVIHTITTEHTGIFKPWAILDDEALEQVGVEISKQIGTVDITELQNTEKTIIDQYNDANRDAGRIRYIPSDKQAGWANKDQLAAYLLREKLDRDLKVVRKALGSAKRSMTTTAKRNKGITYDITQFSVM
jgi:hypothetical protein